MGQEIFLSHFSLLSSLSHGFDFGLWVVGRSLMVSDCGSMGMGRGSDNRGFGSYGSWVIVRCF